jgi:hypothetical protein
MEAASLDGIFNNVCTILEKEGIYDTLIEPSPLA